MPSHETAHSPMLFLFECDGATRYVIYNAAELGNPDDHQPDKWYVRPYPVPVGFEPCDAFDTAEQAKAAVQSHHARGNPER